MACTGLENRLADCPNNGIGIHNCAHSEDAGVTCQEVVVTTPPPGILCWDVCIEGPRTIVDYAKIKDG